MGESDTKFSPSGKMPRTEPAISMVRFRDVRYTLSQANRTSVRAVDLYSTAEVLRRPGELCPRKSVCQTRRAFFLPASLSIVMYPKP